MRHRSLLFCSLWLKLYFFLLLLSIIKSWKFHIFHYGLFGINSLFLTLCRLTRNDFLVLRRLLIVAIYLYYDNSLFLWGLFLETTKWLFIYMRFFLSCFGSFKHFLGFLLVVSWFNFILIGNKWSIKKNRLLLDMLLDICYDLFKLLQWF